MKMSSLAVLALSGLMLAACSKKSEEAPATQTAPDAAPAAPAPAPAPAPDTAAPPAEPTAADRERQQKQGQLDYATMEDSFLNDPKGQWAKDVRVSSTFGDSRSSTSDVNKPANVVGKPNGTQWTNDNQDMGFDWLEATFEKPVHATGVRVVFGSGSETVSKLELKDADGKYTTVWSGINEDAAESRGPRSWFVRTFEKTPNAVVGVKVTIANAVSRGYKTVDAIQLVGE